MRRDKIISGLIAWFLALITALAGIGCIVTGFDLDIAEEWASIHLFCAMFAAIAAVCCSFRWGAPVMAALSLALLVLFRKAVAMSAAILLYRISYLFDAAYGWGVISFGILPEFADYSFLPSPAAALIVIGCGVISAICWVVCRRRWVGFGLFAGLAPLMLCCVVTDTVPEVQCLSFLIGSLMLLTITQLVRRQNVRSGNRLTALALIPVLLLSMVLPQLAQAEDRHQQAQQLQDLFLQWIQPWINGDPDNNNGVIGVGDGISAPESIDLQQAGPLQHPKKRVMTVQSQYHGVLYLRGIAYDTYTGTSWVAQADTTGEGGWPTDGLSSMGTLKISLKYSATDMRFFPYYLLKSDWTSHLTHGMLVYLPRQETYSYDFYTHSGTAQYTPLSSAEEALYLSLPQNTQTIAAEILSGLFGGQDLSTNEKAQLIAEYVQNSASYDLETEKMPEDTDDFALWFLEESNTGYCVHFASAATVLLRAAGIPARYVTGYLTYSQGEAISPVAADEAHAWVEYLNPDCGWSVLEATPGAAQRIEPTEPHAPSEDPTDPSVDVTDPSEEPTAPSEKTTLPSEQTTAPSMQTTVPAGTEPIGGGATVVNLVWIWYVLCVLLAWVVLAIQHRIRRRLRRRWLMKGDEKQRSLRRWRYVRRAVRILKLPHPEHLQALAEKAVFSQHTLTEEELGQFDLWLQKAKRHLLTKPWPIRLALWFIYAI